MAVEQFVMSAYATIVSWTYVLLVILIIVKIIQFFSGGSLFGGGGKDGDGRGGSGKGDGGDGKGSKDKEESKKEKKKREFEEGIENPAYLRFLVRNKDDKSVQGADVTIFARKHKGEVKYGPTATNKDGLVPSDGSYLRVPSGIPNRIEVIYWLSRAEKYKSGKRSRALLGLSKKRRFVVKENVTLKAGEEVTHTINLPFQSEYPEGFEPFIINVDVASEPGKIKTKAIIKSTTGR
jgi:hypothetical protein